MLTDDMQRIRIPFFKSRPSWICALTQAARLEESDLSACIGGVGAIEAKLSRSRPLGSRFFLQSTAQERVERHQSCLKRADAGVPIA
jgi:hypothetical protein